MFLEMKNGKIQKFHKIVTVELLSTIDHKLRGVQQFIVALRGLVENEVLDDLNEEIAELQALYEPYLKLRDLTLEEADLSKFIEDNYNVRTDVSCVVEFDKEKLGFILDFLIEFSKGSYELSLSPADKVCVVNFVSPAFAGLSVDDFNLLSSEIEKLPFFAVRKILGRMSAEFSIKGKEISIEFPRYKKEKT
jgi:hypothetical protein